MIPNFTFVYTPGVYSSSRLQLTGLNKQEESRDPHLSPTVRQEPKQEEDFSRRFGLQGQSTFPSVCYENWVIENIQTDIFQRAHKSLGV